MNLIDCTKILLSIPILPDSEICAVTHVVHQVYDKITAINPTVTFKIKVEMNVPQYLNCDEKKLAQVLVFLVNSLVKAVPTINKIYLLIEPPKSIEIEHQYQQVRILPFLFWFDFPAEGGTQLQTQNNEKSCDML